MPSVVSDLFPETQYATEWGTGIFPDHMIRDFVAAGRITAEEPIGADQIQPASLDLRLGPVAHRVRASFLAGRKGTVAARLDRLRMHSVDLSDGAVLERGCVYIVPLMERLRLTGDYSARANPKSSTGRLDIFTRLAVDHWDRFDEVPRGYKGPLYLEVSPRTFSIVVRAGDRLNQLRFRRGAPLPSDKDHRSLSEAGELTPGEVEARIEDGLWVSVDLSGADYDGLIGYRAKTHTPLIDLGLIGHYDAHEFWQPVHAGADRALILDPDAFYILVSKERLSVPPHRAAEMVAYQVGFGEFRIHYAGFFDPGFGYHEGGDAGTPAVLEVRSHEVPFMLEHGQPVARLVYERLMQRPDRLYGRDIGSSYQRQGLALAKQFKQTGPSANPVLPDEQSVPR